MWHVLLTSKDILIPLASGVVGAVVGAVVGGWATMFFQRKADRKRHVENVLFNVYMMLMEFKGRHFWITSAEIRGTEANPRVVSGFEDIRWRIADEMRKLDQLPEGRDILHVMFSLTYASESGRAEDLNRLLDVLGKRVNPRYDQVMKEITAENQALMFTDGDEFFRRQKRIQPL
jgi:hypothetical protein